MLGGLTIAPQFLRRAARRCAPALPSFPCGPAIAVLLAIVCAALPARAQNTIDVNAGSTTGTVTLPGSRLTVPIIIDLTSAGSTNIASITSGMTWDPARLTFDSIRVVAATGWVLNATTTNAASGTVSFTASSLTAFPSTGPLANVFFTASGGSGGTRLRLMPTAAQNVSSASILASVLPRGYDVCIARTGKWGDANNDGSVNIIDAQQIARFSVGLSVANAPAVSAITDVTNDGTVNIIDAQQIARFSVGLSAAARTNTDSYVAPVVAGVSLFPSASQNVIVGGTAQLSAAGVDQSNTDLTGCTAFTWGSNDPTIATVTPNDGLVTGVSNGAATITATSTVNPGVSVSMTVVVGTPAIRVDVSHVGSPARGYVAQVTGPGIPTFLGYGLVGTNLNGGTIDLFVPGPGTYLVQVAAVDASITAADVFLAGAQAIVTVSNGASLVTQSLTLTPAVFTPALPATVTPGSTIPLSWTIADPAGVIDSRGSSYNPGAVQSNLNTLAADFAGTGTLAPGASVVRTAPGTLQFFATLPSSVTSSAGALKLQMYSLQLMRSGGGDITLIYLSPTISRGLAPYNIDISQVASVTVTPASPSLSVGGTQQLTATAHDASNNVISGLPVTWSSGTTAVATVSGSGLATGVSNGSSVISAVVGGITGTTTLTVSGSLAATQAVATVNRTLNTPLTPIAPVTASGGTTPYSFALTGTLPANLVFDPSTGVLSGTATTTMTATAFTVTITDALNATASKTFTLTVNAALGAVQSVPSRTATVSGAVPAFAPVTASGGTAPYSYALSGAALPLGMAFSTNTGQVSGTPSTTLATTTFTVTVTDAAGATASNVFDLKVNGALSTTQAIAIVNGTNGTLLSVTPVTASGGTAAYSYAISPALPSPLSLNASTGLLSGTPSGALSTTSFTVTVTDAAGATSQKTFTLTLNAPLVATQAVASTSGTVSIQIPAFTPVTASGGSTPYAFALSGGTLPSGMTFNTATGTVSGTPTALLSSTPFTVTVTDAANATASQTFTLQVAAGASVIRVDFTHTGRTARQYVAQISGGTLTDFLSYTLSGTAMNGGTMDLTIPGAGNYVVRIAALDEAVTTSALFLAGAQAAVTVPAGGGITPRSLTLQPAVFTLPSLPTTVTTGTPIPVAFSITDPSGIIDARGGVNFCGAVRYTTTTFANDFSGTGLSVCGITNPAAGTLMFSGATIPGATSAGTLSILLEGGQALRVGSADVTLVYVNPSVARGETPLGVTVAALSGVSVSPPAPSIAIGAIQQLTATALDGAHNPVAGLTVTWASSQPSIATVSPSGLVTALAAGNATITATVGNVSGTATISVSGTLSVGSISVGLGSGTLSGNGTTLATATVRNTSNAVINAAVTWSSTNPFVARVASDGTVQALGTGTTSIRATIGAQSQQASLTVTSVPQTFNIDTRYQAAVPSALVTAVNSAAARWSQLIRSDIPDVQVVNLDISPCLGQTAGTTILTENIDDVVIYVRTEFIDGAGGVLASAGPCFVRSATGQAIVGTLRIDSSDLPTMQQNGSLASIVTHEMAHVLGFGTSWSQLGLITDAVPSASNDPIFTGVNARWAFANLGLSPTYNGRTVPVENAGGSGSRNVHWRESVLARELMTTIVTGSVGGAAPVLPLSPLTAAQFIDLGYVVDVSLSDAQPWSIRSAVRASAAADTPLIELDMPPPVMLDARGRIVGRSVIPPPPVSRAPRR